MSGRHPFNELTRDFTTERNQRNEVMKNELLAEMPLHELRRARALTQRDLAGPSGDAEGEPACRSQA